MKKILLLAAAMLLGMPAQMLAQTDDTEEKKEDVITVTDKTGQRGRDRSPCRTGGQPRQPVASL